VLFPTDQNASSFVEAENSHCSANFGEVVCPFKKVIAVTLERLYDSLRFVHSYCYSVSYVARKVCKVASAGALVRCPNKEYANSGSKDWSVSIVVLGLHQSLDCKPSHLRLGRQLTVFTNMPPNEWQIQMILCFCQLYQPQYLNDFENGS
jgi:hypothetical protein